MKVLPLLLVSLALPCLCSGGHVLFWMPFITPSMKITIEPVAIELAREAELERVTGNRFNLSLENAFLRPLLLGTSIQLSSDDMTKLNS